MLKDRWKKPKQEHFSVAAVFIYNPSMPENAGMFTEQVLCFHSNSKPDTPYAVL